MLSRVLAGVLSALLAFPAGPAEAAARSIPKVAPALGTLTSLPPIPAVEAAPEGLAASAGQAMDGAPALPALPAPAVAADAPVRAAAAPLPAPGPAAERPLPDASGSQRLTYLLPQALRVEVGLGLTAKVLHYALELGMQFVQAGLVYWAGAPLPAALGFLLFELAKTPPVIMAQSLGDLGLRYWWRRNAELRRLAREPHVRRIQVLNSSETRWQGLLAHRQTNRGLVFLHTSEPLPVTLPDEDAPVWIEDISRTRLRLSLELDGAPAGEDWDAPLMDLLDGAKPPKDTAASWRLAIALRDKGRTLGQRLWDYASEQRIQVRTQLIGPGGEIPLGVLAQGSSARRLLGVRGVDRAWERTKAFFARRPARTVERAVPLADARVSRSGRRRLAPKDLWRRLLGRLIVVPPDPPSETP